MQQKSNLFAYETKEFDPTPLETNDRKLHLSRMIESFFKWLTGWVLFTYLIVWLVIDDFSYQTSMYIAGYVNILFGGLLAYTTVIASYSAYSGEAAWAGMATLLNKDIRDARKRAQGFWVGPFIGIILGFLQIVYYS